jgi:hypothetical protein
LLDLRHRFSLSLVRPPLIPINGALFTVSWAVLIVGSSLSNNVGQRSAEWAGFASQTNSIPDLTKYLQSAHKTPSGLTLGWHKKKAAAA